MRKLVVPSRVEIFRNPTGSARYILHIFLLACSLTLLTSCASRTQLMSEVRTELAAGQAHQAYSTYKKKVKDTRDVDKLLILGLLAYEAGDYAEAHRALEQADRLAEERLTKSLSKELAGIAVSDRVRAYQGTVFDRALLHYYRALTFLAENKGESVVVEGRKIAQVLSVNARESKHTYKDDPFLQYFTGSLYDSYGQTNDAWICYKRAHDLYGDFYGVREPDFLCPLTYRTALTLGVPESENNAKECAAAAEVPKENGRVIILAEAGLAPQILQESVTFPIMKYDKRPDRHDDDGWNRCGDDIYHRGSHYHYEESELDYLVHVALPYYPRDVNGTQVTRVVIKDSLNKEYTASLGTDLGAILRKDLDDRKGAIAARAIARAVLKYTASKAAEKVGDKEDKTLGKILGFAINAAGALTEAADTRSWETLPDKIYVADLSLPPGGHELRVLFQDELGGTVFRFDVGKVNVDSNTITMVRTRTTK